MNVRVCVCSWPPEPCWRDLGQVSLGPGFGWGVQKGKKKKKKTAPLTVPRTWRGPGRTSVAKTTPVVLSM